MKKICEEGEETDTENLHTSSDSAQNQDISNFEKARR